eukprot:s2560_g12.t5
MSLHADGDDRGLTEDVARELCQCFRKSWELSLGDLGQSCREAVASCNGQSKLSEALTAEARSRRSLEALVRSSGRVGPMKVCSWRQADIQQRQSQFQSMAQAVERVQIPTSSVEKLVKSWLDACVEEVQRRTTDVRDGQLFNERFLASFPVQGDTGLEQAVAAELHGHAKLLGTFLKSEVPLQTKRACKKQLGATIQGGCEVLSEAVVEALLEAAAALKSDGRCVEASRRLRVAPAVEAVQLAKEVPKALQPSTESRKAPLAFPSSLTDLLGKFRICFTPLEVSLQTLEEEVQKASSSLTGSFTTARKAEGQGHEDLISLLVDGQFEAAVKKTFASADQALPMWLCREALSGKFRRRSWPSPGAFLQQAPDPLPSASLRCGLLTRFMKFSSAADLPLEAVEQNLDWVVCLGEGLQLPAADFAEFTADLPNLQRIVIALVRLEVPSAAAAASDAQQQRLKHSARRVADVLQAIEELPDQFPLAFQ